jgi:hypothetical protein
MTPAALAGHAVSLACIVVVFLTIAFIPEISAAGRSLREMVFEPAARAVAAIAAGAAFAAALLTAGVALAGAPLSRAPGDIVYSRELAVRADGRLALADGVTLAAAARAFAGPGDYWAAACRASLPGWRWPVDWRGADAIGRPLWRASLSDRGGVTVDGLGPAETAQMRALLGELAGIVACD